MSKYQIFVALFIISVCASVVFMGFYLQSIFSFMPAMQHDAMNGTDFNHNPFNVFASIFTPGVIISFLITATASLTLRIYGIVLVAKNKQVTDGEKALWIVGFILMCFITSIVFLVMAKGKKYVD